MNKINYKLYYILILVLIVSLFTEINIYSQSDLRKDITFFNSKKKEISYWLEKTGVGQVFYLDKIDVKKSKLYMYFASSYKSMDSLNVAWQMLKYSYDSTDNKAVSKKLFNSMAFEMELGKDSLEIELASNIKNFRVEIKFNKKHGTVVKENDKSKLTRTFNVISLQLEEFDLPSSAASEGVKNMSMRSIRTSISKFLTNYYKDKGTFWYESKFEVLQESYNELTFEVSRLSKEILSDRSYFEYIRIDVTILKKNDEIDIKYDIMGKYSGGFGFEPRRSEYRNMEPDFLDYLKRYQLKLSRKIEKSLIKR